MGAGSQSRDLILLGMELKNELTDPSLRILQIVGSKLSLELIDFLFGLLEIIFIMLNSSCGDRTSESPAATETGMMPHNTAMDTKAKADNLMIMSHPQVTARWP